MANTVEIGSTETTTPLAPGGPIPEPDKLERITSKQDEVKEEAVKAYKGQKDGKETNSRRDSLDRLNTALVLSVAAVAVVGAIVSIAKKLRER